MTPWMRRIHKWLGLVIGLQFILWLASGLLIGLFDPAETSGARHRAQMSASLPWPQDGISHEHLLGRFQTPVVGLASRWLIDRPVYELTDGDARWIVDAIDGRTIDIDSALVSAVARASYVGDGTQKAPVLLAHSLEARDHAMPVWRVDFSDPEDTTVYVSAQTGQVLEHRNSSWRLHDLLWMLHIMDYTGREDYNNPLLIVAGMAGLWLAMAGGWLLVVSFNIREFIPARWRRTRKLTVLSPDGSPLRSVHAAEGESMYVALARNGLQLPSNCGGGESCGLCEVRVRDRAPPPTSAECSHLSKARLDQGYRLACGLLLHRDIEVEVAGGAALWSETFARVESVRPVTPLLREIVLKAESPLDAGYRPGAYIQVAIPGYSLRKDEIGYPPHHREAWQEIEVPDTITNPEPVRRAYSLALPVSAADGRLTLLARFQPGRADDGTPVVGKGSTYLYSLKPGDRIRFNGPFGDFAIRPGGREKVFIGGGAGMAPLRAMIHSCLASGARERMHFWYGARSLVETPYADEMMSLARDHGNFSWHPVLSEDASNEAFLQGFVHDVAHEFLLCSHPDLDACDFYLCGPPAMLTATRSLLKRLGIAENRIAFDDFKI